MLWNIWATWSNTWQSYGNDRNDHIAKEMIIRTYNVVKNNPKDQLHVQHLNNAKYTKYLHQRYKILLGYKCNIKQNKTKQGFLIKKCVLTLGIHISPMAFSPYKCAWGRISPPKNVHMSHIEMTKHTGILSSILSPFLS